VEASGKPPDDVVRQAIELAQHLNNKDAGGDQQRMTEAALTVGAAGVNFIT
jgi:hypothetical protein